VNPGGRFGDTDPDPGGGAPIDREARLDDVTTSVDPGIESPTNTGTTSADITDQISGGIDRVQSAGAGVQNELQETFPGRTGEAAALGAGIAAVPEPTPATEITGGAIVGGAALAGGAILASRAARNSELEIGDFTPNELEPSGRTRQEIREQEVTGSAGIGNNELQPTGGTVAVSELDVGATQQQPELEVGGNTGTGGTANQPADDTVVPGEFPLPGRDIPRDPTQEAGDEPSPGDVVGGADFTTGVTIGSGTGTGSGTGRGREVDPGRTGTGTGTASEILDEVRRDINTPVERGPGGAFRPEREFPTGAGAVVGRAIDRAEQGQQPGVGEIGVGAGVGVGASGAPRDPLAPPAEDQRRDRPAGFGVGTGIGQGVGTGLGTDTGTDTPPGFETDTGTDTGVGTGTGTATETALEEMLFIQEETVVENQPALENPPAQETALEQALAQPTLAELGFGSGGTSNSEPEEDERFPFDDDSGDTDPLALLASRDDAVFGSGITGGGEALGELFDRDR
jgi:hypothetical protein